MVGVGAKARQSRAKLREGEDKLSGGEGQRQLTAVALKDALSTGFTLLCLFKNKVYPNIT